MGTVEAPLGQLDIDKSMLGLKVLDLPNNSNGSSNGLNIQCISFPIHNLAKYCQCIT